MRFRPVRFGPTHSGSTPSRGRPRIAKRAASLGAAAVMAATSVLSIAPAPARAAEYMVVSTDDSGAGTLRQAILDANASPGSDVISFGFEGPYPLVIQPATPLPAITGSVTIDGSIGGNPAIRLDGTLIADVVGSLNENGLTLNGGAGGSTITGLQVVRFPDSGIMLNGVSGVTVEGNYLGTDGAADLGNGGYGLTLLGANGNTILGNVASGNGAPAGTGGCCSAGFGIWLGDANAANNTIKGNRIGTNAAGTAAIGNQNYGLEVRSPDNTIGGTTAADRNLISGNGRGVHFVGTTLQGNVFQGNRVGTNAAGTAAIANGSQAILLNGTDDAITIGGTAAGAGNLISGNGSAIILGSSSNALIQGNLVGVAADGTTPLGNGGAGVTLNPGTSATVGGSAAGAGNVIANNTGAGVLVLDPSTGNSILGNSIHDNGALGIDLGNSGVTANDAGDVDTGANGLQNFPVITSTSPTNVAGTLDSAPGATYRIELFSNTTCDASEHGEGAQLLKVAVGQAPGPIGFDVPVFNGTFLTATATNETTGETSEFGPCFEVTDALPAPGSWSAFKSATTAGTFMAAGNGAAGPAQFTYDRLDPLPNVADGGGESGEWTFFTTAGSPGSITVPWRYTGFHAFAGVTVGLRAVVIRDGDTEVSSEVLVDAGPQSCCTTPSAGFDYTGSATFAVQAGDVYGFELTGTNGDSNDTLKGQLILGTQVPTSCSNAQTLYDTTSDGRYVIHPIDGQQFSVYCDGMNDTPRDYLDLNVERIGQGYNFASYDAGDSQGTDVVTSFTKLRFDPATLRVDIGDLTFATSTGSLTHPDQGGPQTVASMPYGVAMACNSGEWGDGAANVDLWGTPFAVDDAWVPLGTGSEFYGGAIFSGADQTVDITANGFCGWRTPDPATSFFVWETPPGQAYLQLRYLNAPPEPTLATPVLFASVTTAPNTADVYGLVAGAANQHLDLEIHASAACVGGVLQDPAPVIGSASVTTDAEGYFKVAGQSGLPSGRFVAVHVTSPATTDVSSCVRTSADNDYWPKALALGNSASVSTQDVIDVRGKARWYRIPVVPDQRVTVRLKNLPADYDLAVFKDIAKEFAAQLAPEDTTDLTRLSAEFAPSVFSPSVFSPSVFSPSVFSPDAYAPSVFSPSVFSPSVFSPSVFSPSVFSPSVFSPSVFSPSVFSPSVFSPSVFSPSVFSPSVFSPSVFSEEDVARAFSSAQTRSLIGVSAQAGPGDESVVVNSWNNTGDVYIRVSGRSGAFDLDGLFTVEIEKSASTCDGVTDTTLTPRADAPSAGVQSVILTDSSILQLGDAGNPASLRASLDDFIASREVAGIPVDALVDVAGDVRVGELKAQVAAHPACPFAVNLLAEEIKGIVDSYRANNPGLRYVTILGGDTVIPFFRYPDQSLLGQESGYFPPVKSDSISEASLRRDYVLSQDAYGSGVSVSLRINSFPVPGLAVGRLVETPSEIAALLDAYVTANGTITPETSLVTGYDFLEDAAKGVRDELAAGTGTAPDDTLITPNGVSPSDPQSWTADQLRAKLLTGGRHDLVYLAGHFSANSALAADFSTSVITTELAASSANLVNTIVFSAGCHSGYNLLDAEALPGASLPLDWAQAFSQKRAILLAGTGYQYGDTDFLEYSERLYRDFARELRTGTIGTAVSIGEALRNAKLTYLSTTPDIRGIHEKALLEATLFGLPMWGVDMDGQRTGTPGAGTGIAPAPVTSGPASTLGLATAPLLITPNLGPRKTLDLVNAPYTNPADTTTASWYEGPGGAVTTNPAEPTLPLLVRNVTSTTSGYVLRGIGFRGGSYTDTSAVTPLTGAPTTELRGVHAPFVSPVFFPMRPWTPNYFGALGGSGGTNLLTTPVQYRADPANPGKGIERKYTGLELKLFYSNNLTTAALSEAPTIVSVEAVPDGSDLIFSAEVVGDPKAAVHTVWVTWTTGTGTWAPLDLAQCVAPLPAACGTTEDSRIWRGRLLNSPANIQYVIQAANGLGMVSLSDNLGAYFGQAAAAPSAATLELVDPPTSGTFGETRPVTVRLTSGTTDVGGRTVFVTIGGTTASGTTDANGRTTVNVPLSSLPGATQVSASFGGDDTYGAASAPGQPFSIGKAASSLAVTAGQNPVDYAAGTTVSATLSSGGTPLLQRTVAFLVTAPGGSTTLALRTTDFTGKATLNLPSGTVGSYGVEARFGSVVNVPGGGTVDLTDATYGAAAQEVTVTMTAATVTTVTLVRSPQPYVYDSSPFGATAGVTGPGLDTTLSPTYTGTTFAGNVYGPTATAPTDAGSYRATATYAANGGYVASEASVDYVVGRAASTVTLTLNGTSPFPFDGQPHGATAVASGVGGLNVPLTVTYSGTGSTVYPSTTTAPTAAGSYIAQATYLGGSNHTGNAASAAFTIVPWPFTGFFAPVDNLPTLNTATAGQTIPVKFSLGGNRGLAIFQPGYPRAVTVACQANATLDVIEEVSTATTSGLQYDATTNRYQYNWKTAKTMAGKCWQLQLGLKDGSTAALANFKFK